MLTAGMWLHWLYSHPAQKEHERKIEEYWSFKNRFGREVAARHKKLREQAKKPKAKIVIALESKQDIHCPLCRDSLEEPITSCDNCNAVYHNECLIEMTGEVCSTLGCKRKLEVEKKVHIPKHQSMDLNKVIKNSQKFKMMTRWHATGRRPQGR